MPWRGPEVEGELPSLGWDLLEWGSDLLPSPRDADEPLVFTDEQALLLVAWFTVDPRTGRFLFRRGCSRRSKGWGKSPLEAFKAIAELAGPVRFAGWDSSGEPVGRPWGAMGDPNAWVQIAAVSEDQTENTHSVVYEFLTANDGKAADNLCIDAGLTRSYLRDGKHRGKLEPVTAAFGTREGQPVTYGVLDETHLWTPTNGGRRLAATIRRNVGKMDGRSYETTNSFEPGEGSVAEQTHKAAENGAAGVFYDAVEAPEVDLEAATDDELVEALKVPYGDSWWVDLRRLVAEVRDPDTAVEDSERYFFNWNRKGGGKAVDPKRWAELARPTHGQPPDGARIGLGFDGSISEDATALVGCTEDGFVFVVEVWERPLGAKEFRVPRLAVHATVAGCMERWRVGRMFCDPPRWSTEIEQWAELWNVGKRDDEDVVLFFDTNQARRMAPACDRFSTALAERALTHDGSDVLTRHALALTKKKVRLKDEDDDGRTRYVFTKGPDGRKIDAGIGAVLAFEAAMTMPEQRDVPVLAGVFGGGE